VPNVPNPYYGVGAKDDSRFDPYRMQQDSQTGDLESDRLQGNCKTVIDLVTHVGRGPNVGTTDLSYLSFIIVGLMCRML